MSVKGTVATKKFTFLGERRRLSPARNPSCLRGETVLRYSTVTDLAKFRG